MKQTKEDSQYDDIANEMVSSSSVTEPPIPTMFIPAGVDEEPLFAAPDKSPDTKKVTPVKKEEEDELEVDNLETEELQEPEEEVKEKTTKEEDEPVVEPDLGEYETDITKFVVEKLEDKLGITMDDSITSVDSIVDELARIVEESSKPTFANEEVEKLNDFVNNGGSVKQYFASLIDTKLDLTDIDMEDPKIQKRVIKESLKNAGYTEKQIERKIERYEEIEALAEEAEDALEVLKEYNKQKEEKLLKDQENRRIETEKQQQKFISNVQAVIKDTKNILGIPISDKEKKDLYNYIFVPDRDGYTRYQKEYSSDVRNIIRSAFFQMKGDTLIERASAKGATETAKSLKEKLAQKGKRIKKSGSLGDDEMNAFDLLAKKLGR